MFVERNASNPSLESSYRKGQRNKGMRRACLKVDSEILGSLCGMAEAFPSSGQFARVIAYLVWGIPYLMPTPTRGSALIIFFTVAWSENANRIEAVNKKVLKCEL